MLTVQNLIDDLATGCKPKSEWRIGVELEQFAYNKKTGKPLPYQGNPSIRALLEDFSATYGWTTINENGRPIALTNNNAVLSLEPGGQVEYSGPPLSSLAEVKSHMNGFYQDLQAVAAKHDIAFLSAGFHPYWRRSDIHWMPKQRHEIMRDYMPKVGSHGIDMMLRACGMQVNLDYSSEADMVRKFRVAMALQPAIIALTANSSCVEGNDVGYASYRSFMWTDTDNDRCGVLPFVFEPDMSFARYVEYALDVPMYFIRREERYIDVTGKSFRDFMKGRLPGHEGEFPSLEDWNDHLTTLFPEVRLKHYIELRGPDSNPPETVLAMAAFWAGILYNETILEQAHEIVMKWPVEEHARLRERTPRDGLETLLIDGQNMHNFATTLLDLASQGLGEQAFMLAPLYDRLNIPYAEKRICDSF